MLRMTHSMSVASRPALRRSVLTLAAGVAAVAGVALTPVAPSAQAAAPVVTTPSVMSADALPTVQINGVAWNQVVVGDTVYVVGSFTSARPAGVPAGTDETPREYLLAYDIRTGDLVQSFHHVLNAEATSIAASPDGTRIYVGGKFTSVDGVSRYRLAAFDVATGNLVTGFKPIPSGSVGTVAATDTTVYFGGAFGNVNGVARTRAAAVTTSGGLLPWAPTIDNYGINTMIVTPDQSGVVLGGRFSSINGAAAYGTALVDSTTGATRPWALNQVIKGSNTAGTLTLATDGSLIFGGNYTYGNGNYEGTWAADPSTGAIVWANDCLGDTYSVYPVAGTLYVTGHTHSCSSIGAFPETNPRSWHYAMAFSTAPGTDYNSGPDAYGWNYSAYHTSAMRQWFPILKGSTSGDSAQAAWSISGNSDYIVYAGEFPKVNNTAQQGLVRFPAHTISPNAYGPTGLGTPTAAVSRDANGATTVTVRAQGAYDRDDATLNYELYRNGGSTPIATTTSPSSGFWTTQATVTLTDTAAPPDSSVTYKVVAKDPWGRRLGTSVTVSTAVPAWQPQAGAVSTGPQGYQAAVGPTSLTDRVLTVPFTATGSWTLPSPSGSCLVVGGTTVAPNAISLTTSQWGRYVGTATYTLPSSGTYAWRYGCRSDFSTPTIGVATLPGA